MRYGKLGNTGLVVSRMAFGAMTFGTGEGAMGSVHKVDQTQADALVARALDAGVTHFNTADAYAGGRSEEMLGRALGTRRRDVVISTKVGFRTGPSLMDSGLSRRHVLASVDASLTRLGTDWIDVYLVHRVDPHTPLEETLEALDHVVRAGKVRYVGFSNWPAWLAAKALGLQREHGWARFRAAEVYYSLVGRDLEHELAPFLDDAGIGTLIWSPLAGGFLSGKYTREDPGGGGGRLSGFDIIPFDREHGFAVVDVLRDIAQAHEAKPAQVALAWLLTKPHVTSILVGASKVTQLDENLAAASLELTHDEIARLDEASAPRSLPYPRWFVDGIRDTPMDDALTARATRSR